MKLDQTSRDVLTVLQKAARRVARKDGWLQGYIGDWHSRTGAVCAVGAIKAVDGDPYRPGTVGYRSREFLTRFVPRYHNGLIQSVEGFNDHPGRRQVSIVALFNRAIKNLKTKGLTG